MMGWRKLSAWGLVFGLAAFATYAQYEIPGNNVDMVKWVTGFFFGANAVKPLAGVIGAKVAK